MRISERMQEKEYLWTEFHRFEEFSCVVDVAAQALKNCPSKVRHDARRTSYAGKINSTEHEDAGGEGLNEPFSVSLRSALSLRIVMRYSEREVNIRSRYHILL